MFQIEIVEGAHLYACNACDEGFEKDDKIRKHIESDNKDIKCK